MKHDHCNCEIRWRHCYGAEHPIAGLFCIEHDAWIKWLPREEAFYAIDKLKVPVNHYTPRKAHA